VLWLIKDLASTSEKLKAGDVISLGSFARPLPPQPSQTVSVQYDGLPGGPFKVSVHFAE
jgi:2-keto-4-pentenoate hydratase